MTDIEDRVDCEDCIWWNVNGPPFCQIGNGEPCDFEPKKGYVPR